MSTILTNNHQGVAILTLNRPDKYNSFNSEMATALQDALDAAAGDPAIRCVCITGSGKAFCAGQDLAEATSPDAPAMGDIVSQYYNPIISRLRSIPKPIVAAVNGVAAGAGTNIALAADIVVAAEEASFIQAFSKIGLIPDSGGTYTLPRLIGQQMAAALMMTGDKLSAADALRMGMIYKTWPAATFEAGWMALCVGLAAMPTRALALTKELLNESLSNDLATQLARERELQIEAGQTHDFKEGVAAFLEKRAPEFKGE
jgi:2-(1,2-epoxy-1,2-dihydrophenyl)acetyl-CoA isomerase